MSACVAGGGGTCVGLSAVESEARGFAANGEARISAAAAVRITARTVRGEVLGNDMVRSLQKFCRASVPHRFPFRSDALIKSDSRRRGNATNSERHREARMFELQQI